MTRVIAADLGGTRLKTCLVSGMSAGPITLEPTAGLTGEAALELLLRAARKVGAGKPAAFGLAVPGLVDGGRVVALPGKFAGLTDIDLGAELERTLQVPVAVMNDAIAAALGEAVAGAGRGDARLVMLTIGTGVGTAVIEAGEPMGRGPLGGGLLAGQMPMPSESEYVDTNGRSDTIEAAIAAPRLLQLAQSHGVAVESLPQLAELTTAGDAAAISAVSLYRNDLATACVALVHAYAPDILVIGGGPVSGNTEWVVNGLQEAVSARLWPGVSCRIATSELGDAAALIGVATAAQAQLKAPM